MQSHYGECSSAIQNHVVVLYNKVIFSVSISCLTEENTDMMQKVKDAFSDCACSTWISESPLKNRKNDRKKCITDWAVQTLRMAGLSLVSY